MKCIFCEDIVSIVKEIQEAVPEVRKPVGWVFVNNECVRIISGQQDSLASLVGELRKLGTPECVGFANRLEEAAPAEKASGAAAGGAQNPKVSRGKKQDRRNIDHASPHSEGKDRMDITWVPVDRLNPHPLTEHMFPISENTCDAIAEDMGENGVSVAHPVEAVESEDGKMLVFAGRTRLAAMRKNKTSGEVPVVVYRGLSDDEILTRCVMEQALRRQNDDRALLICIRELEPVARKIAQERRGDRNDLSPGSGTSSGKRSRGAAEIIAMKLGVSRGKVEQGLKVLGVPAKADRLIGGTDDGCTINSLYAEIMQSGAEKKEIRKPPPGGKRKTGVARRDSQIAAAESFLWSVPGEAMKFNECKLIIDLALCDEPTLCVFDRVFTEVGEDGRLRKGSGGL